MVKVKHSPSGLSWGKAASKSASPTTGAGIPKAIKDKIFQPFFTNQTYRESGTVLAYRLAMT